MCCSVSQSDFPALIIELHLQINECIEMLSTAPHQLLSCDSCSTARAWRPQVASSSWFRSRVFWRSSPSTATWSSSTTCSLGSTVCRWALHSSSETVWQVIFCLFPDPLPSSVIQGPFVFFFRIVFNKEARNAMKYCCSRKRPDHMIKSKASVSPSEKTLTSVRHVWDVELTTQVTSVMILHQSLNI